METRIDMVSKTYSSQSIVSQSKRYGVCIPSLNRLRDMRPYQLLHYRMTLQCLNDKHSDIAISSGVLSILKIRALYSFHGHESLHPKKGRMVHVINPENFVIRSSSSLPRASSSPTLNRASSFSIDIIKFSRVRNYWCQKLLHAVSVEKIGAC